MRLFKPQLNLTRKTINESTTEFFLFSTTHFNNTEYIAKGNDSLQLVTPPDSNGGTAAYYLRLNVEKSSAEASLSYIKPITHTVTLGALTKPFEIEVEVFSTTENRQVGKSVIKDEEADEDAKPNPMSSNQATQDHM